MSRLVHACALTVATTLAGGCVTPAPGAAQVTITRNPADVSACTPVGNIGRDAMGAADPNIARNQAVGLNANVILNTGGGGVAYHCEKPASAQQ